MEQSIPPQIDEHADETESSETLWSQLRDWMRNQLPWWSMSFTIHVVALASLLLLGRFTMSPSPHDDIASFLPTEQTVPPVSDVEPVVLDGQYDVDPKRLDVETPPDPVGLPDAPPGPTTGSPTGDPNGNPEPSPGLVDSPNTSEPFVPRHPGSGPSNEHSPIICGSLISDPTRPYVPRIPPGSIGPGKIDGRTPASEHAVTAAIYWFAHHQSRDGSWSLQDYTKQCKDRTCTGTGAQESLSAATAMGVLPFLGAGITHTGKSKYASIVQHAVYWLVNHQKPDGDLSAGASQQMYSHALATIALCEAYGMTNDKLVGAAAQKAINFIVAAQNVKTGGWRYHPGDDGDTSVTGWQLMALKSGQMAKLNVNPGAFDGVKRWLMTVAKTAPGEGSAGSGQFSYQPEGAATPTMSAVGLLCSQYLRAGRADPVIVGGVKYLLANQPSEQTQNIYYWYYAAQVMHNMNDKDWDRWNRTMRTVLVNTQAREGCAAGSWDPDKPVRDAWGPAGGRVMMTSLSALTLEVYYRYLPLYQLDKPDGGK